MAGEWVGRGGGGGDGGTPTHLCRFVFFDALLERHRGKRDDRKPPARPERGPAGPEEGGGVVNVGEDGGSGEARDALHEIGGDVLDDRHAPLPQALLREPRHRVPDQDEGRLEVRDALDEDLQVPVGGARGGGGVVSHAREGSTEGARRNALFFLLEHVVERGHADLGALGAAKLDRAGEEEHPWGPHGDGHFLVDDVLAEDGAVDVSAFF